MGTIILKSVCEYFKLLAVDYTFEVGKDAYSLLKEAITTNDDPIEDEETEENTKEKDSKKTESKPKVTKKVSKSRKRKTSSNKLKTIKK